MGCAEGSPEEEELRSLADVMKPGRVGRWLTAKADAHGGQSQQTATCGSGSLSLWFIGGGLGGNNLGIHDGDWIFDLYGIVSGALTTPLTRMLPMMLARATSQRDGRMA